MSTNNNRVDHHTSNPMNPSVRDLYSQRKHCRKPLAQTQDLKHGKAHDGQVIAASSSLPPEATQNKATYLKDMPTISGLTALEPYILSPEATQSKAADLKDMPTISGLTSLKPSILPPEATQNKATDLKGMPTTSGLTTVEPSSLPSEATQNEATDLKGIPAICSMTTLEPSIRTPEATQSEATDLKGRPTISGLTTLEPSILPSEATQDKATNFSQPHEAPQDEASKFSQACEATKDKAGGLIVCPTAIGSANSEPMNKQNSAPHVKPLRASLPSLVDQPHGGALDKAKTQTLKLDDPVPNTLPSSAPNVSLPNLHPLAQRELQAKPPLKRARRQALTATDDLMDLSDEDEALITATQADAENTVAAAADAEAAAAAVATAAATVEAAAAAASLASAPKDVAAPVVLMAPVTNGVAPFKRYASISRMEPRVPRAKGSKGRMLPTSSLLPTQAPVVRCTSHLRRVAHRRMKHTCLVAVAANAGVRHVTKLCGGGGKIASLLPISALAPLSQQPPGSLVLSSQQPAGSCHTSVTHSATQTNKRRRTGDIAILSGGGPDVPAVPAPPGRPAVANILPDCPAPSFSSRPSYPVDPKETVGISAKETVGISAKETVGISAKETVGISAKETVGISPKETQVVSAEEAAPSVLTLELDVLFSNFTSKGYSVKGTASAAVAPGLDASSGQTSSTKLGGSGGDKDEHGGGGGGGDDSGDDGGAPPRLGSSSAIQTPACPPSAAFVPPSSSAPSPTTPSPLVHPSVPKSVPSPVSPPPSLEQLLTPPEPPPSSASPETPSPLEDPSTSRSAPGLVSPPYSVEQLLIPPEPPTSSASAATPSPLEHPSTSKSAPDLVSPPPSGEQLLTPPEPPPSSASPETPSPLEHHVTSKSTSDLASPPHSVEQLLTPPKPPLSYASGQSLVTPPKRSDRTPSHVSVAPSLGSDCTPSHVSVAPSPGSDCTPSAASGSSPSHISRSAAQKPDPLPLALFPSPSPSPSRSRSPNKRTASQAPGPSESTHLDALSLLTSQDPLAILRQHRQQRMWAAMSKAARSPMHYDNHPSSADASRLPSKQSPPSAHHVLSPSKNMSPPSSHLKAGSSRSGPEAAQQFPPKLACKEIRESGCDGESSTNGMVDIARYLVTQPVRPVSVSLFQKDGSAAKPQIKRKPGPYVTASYTLEQELRDSFINCQLANEWHNNNSPWARMDIAGLETGLTSYITQFNRLQACRKKITAYRGVTSVATLQQRLDKEWKHLKAIRVRSMESAAAQEGQCVNGEDRLPGRIAARAVASSARDGTVPANGCDTDGASEVVEASHVLSPSVGDCTREGEADDDKDARASEPASGDAIDTALSCEGGADANRDAGGCGLPVAENPRSILRNYEASISRRTIPVSKTVAFAPALELGAQSGYSMS